jgi:Skp family chaperone for outer membrane proteins
MKTRAMVLWCLAGVVVLAMGYEYSRAQPQVNEPALKMGIVNVGRALRNCNATVKYRERITAENSKMDAEEERLSKEIQALGASLKALKTDSIDYLERYEELLQKQGELKALQEFNPRRKVLRDLQWTQNLYKEILRITKEIAAEKGLSVVLGANEPEFPIQRYDELMMTLSTHKVLYSGGCVDITNEVVARLDETELKFGN